MNTQQLEFSKRALETLPHLGLERAKGSNIEVGTVHFLAGQRSPAEGTNSHQSREVSLILTGQLEVTSGGVKRTLGEGTLIEIPPGEEHFSAALQDCKVLYFLIDE